MKRAIFALLVASGCIGSDQGSSEENCKKYQTVLEETFGQNDGWEPTFNGYCYQGYKVFATGCYSSPVCPEDSKAGYVLSWLTPSLSKTFSVPANVAIDRLVLTGNSYGEYVDLEIIIEGLNPIDLYNLKEEEDCKERVIDIHEFERHGDYRNRSITGDGKFYLKILLKGGDDAPERPLCHYSCVCASPGWKECDEEYTSEEKTSLGVYGLSKIQFQQCAK